MPARSKATVARPASAVQQTRENPAVEQGGAAPKVVDDKPGAETERTSGVAIVSDPIPSVPSEAEKTARGNDAGEQPAALKPAEKLSAEARAAQEDAAVQAFLDAQEAGRQAQAARDAAAAKEAAQRARAARQNANRPFIHSLFGVR
jgi:hypothetical protein